MMLSSTFICVLFFRDDREFLRILSDNNRALEIRNCNSSRYTNEATVI